MAMKRKLTKADLEASRADGQETPTRLRELAEKAQAELDRKKQRSRRAS